MPPSWVDLLILILRALDANKLFLSSSLEAIKLVSNSWKATSSMPSWKIALHLHSKAACCICWQWKHEAWQVTKEWGRWGGWWGQHDESEHFVPTGGFTGRPLNSEWLHVKMLSYFTFALLGPKRSQDMVMLPIWTPILGGCTKNQFDMIMPILTGCRKTMFHCRVMSKVSQHELSGMPVQCSASGVQEQQHVLALPLSLPSWSMTLETLRQGGGHSWKNEISCHSSKTLHNPLFKVRWGPLEFARPPRLTLPFLRTCQNTSLALCAGLQHTTPKRSRSVAWCCHGKGIIILHA